MLVCEELFCSADVLPGTFRKAMRPREAMFVVVVSFCVEEIL